MNSRKNSSDLAEALRSLLVNTVLTALLCIYTFSVLFGVTVQQGNSMSPAIKDGDIIVYYRRCDPYNGAAVVYERADNAITGRIAAVPGAVISETGDGTMEIDGIMIENTVMHVSGVPEGMSLPVSLGDNQYYILNDDRARADDSRTYGGVEREKIKGCIIAVLRRRAI